MESSPERPISSILEGQQPEQMEGQQTIVSSLPPPPPFYTLFKDKFFSSAEDDVSESESSNELLPPDPPKPIEGTYMMFGKPYTTEDLLPSLEEQNRKQLYAKGKDINHTEELKKLNKLLLAKFLELLHILTTQPDGFQQRVEEIELILVNMHHLLNSYRPHQSRQTLISCMEQQIQSKQQTIQSIQQQFKQVNDILDSLYKLADSSTTLLTNNNSTTPNKTPTVT